MRLEWIEDILAVAETGAFNTAAERRFLTASAFTRRIKTIEETLGCELFNRSTKPITLHPHVQNCLLDLKQSATNLNRLKHQLSQPYDSLSEQVTLAYQHALTGTIAPRLIQHSGLGGQMNMRIKSGSMSECLLQLFNGETEFALIYQLEGEQPQVDLDVCIWRMLGRETFIPVATPLNCAALRQAPTSDGRTGPHKVPIIEYPSTIFLGQVQHKVLNLVSQQDFQLICVAETGLSLAVVEFVRQGIGIGWVPRALIEDDLSSGALISLEPILPSFNLDIILMRLKRDLPRLSELFWDKA